MLSMNNERMKEYNTFVGINLPISSVESVLDFKKRYRVKTKGDAFKQLIDLALFVESKLGLVQSITNEELETIKEQIETGQVVDYFMRMDQRKFNLIVNIMKDEEKARTQKRL